MLLEMALDESDQKRESVSVNLTPSSKRALEAWRDETGIPKTEALDRLLNWFFKQSEDVRRAILARTYNPAAGVESADIAALAETMRAIAARFDALTAKPAKPLVRLPKAESEPAQPHRKK